mmetsp:Transcript_18686/g.26316  ORF Transcript_18686/g.26316 Transcript_18686/m.26316 type:complete len:544 (-) Transcript_18686:99-1730(-)
MKKKNKAKGVNADDNDFSVDGLSFPAVDFSSHYQFLNNLPFELQSFNNLDLLDSLISVACSDIIDCSHDLSLYICLHHVYAIRYFGSHDDFDSENACKALETSLEIVDHSNAVGMFGWLDYGSSHALDRTLERPYETLSELAAFHGSVGKWHDASTVLRSLVLRCEQYLPLYHPITITALLDLAATMMNIGERLNAFKIIDRACSRLNMYLGEQEQACSMMHDMYSRSSSDFDSFEYHKQMGLDHLAMLKSFVCNMRYLLRRKMLSVLGRNNPMSVLFQCFVGDSMAVLALCLDIENKITSSSNSFGEKHDFQTPDKDPECGESYFVWMIAGEHYKSALRGWAISHGMHHPNIPSTACSLSRCLHELGRTAEAMKLLFSVVGSRKTGYEKMDINNSSSSDSINIECATTLIFEPPNMYAESSGSSAHIKVNYDQSIAICLWSLAVYSIKEMPNEEGKSHALNYLHSASMILQNSLNSVLNVAESDKHKCTELLLTIENEAKNLFSGQFHEDATIDVPPYGNKKQNIIYENMRQKVTKNSFASV